MKRKRASKTGVTVGKGVLDFHAIADTSLNGIIVFQGEHIVYVNPAAMNMVGYSKDELLGMRFWEVMHPDFRDMVRAYGFGKLRGEQAESRIEIKVVRKDGRELWVDAFSSCIEYDGRPAVLVTAVDITGRKQAVEALTDSQQMLKLVMDSIPQGVFWKDRNSVYIGCNKVFAEATGLGTPENVRGKTDYDLPWSREQADLFRECDRRIMDNDTPEYHIIEQQRESGGRNAWLETNKVPLHNTHGIVTGILGTYEDITERKRAEEAVSKLRANLEKSQEIAHLGSWELDLLKNILYWSDEVYRIFGLQPQEFGATYEAFITAVHPDDREAVDAAYTRSVREGRDTYEIEHRILKKPTGEVRFVHEKCEHFRDESGRITRSVGMIHDITERKRAEEAIKFANAYNRSLIEASLDPLVTIAPDGRITDVNAATEAVTGYPREKLIGTDFSDYFTDPARAHEGYRKVFAEGSVIDYPLEIKRKDGHITPVLSNATVYRDETGKVIGAFTAARDVTERKRAEDALRESEAMLTSIFRSAPTGIGVVADRVIVAVNDKLCQMTGYSRDELLGQSARLFYPSEEEYEHAGKVKYDMIRERGTGEVETCWRCKDGRLINVLLSSSPVATDNLSAGVTFTALDITKRKRAEDEVKEARSQAELYLDLMGHDINNMHQIALGYLELARDLHPEAGQGEYLDKPIEVLQRSARLIRNVRKLQKLRDGLFQTELVDVCQLLLDMQREFGAVPHKAVKLNLNGHKHCPVRANELLHDVFANLLSNAIKHTGDRANILVDLDIVWSDGRQCCRVMVEDDGPGISDDFKGRIFHRMLRGTTKAKGIGLGLYLVKSLVESYGGRVWVEDRIVGDHTKGARFVIILPAIEK